MDEADRAQVASDVFLAESLGNRHTDSRPLVLAATHCEDCEEEIPEARRLAAPGCTRCVDCQQAYENLMCGGAERG